MTNLSKMMVAAIAICAVSASAQDGPPLGSRLGTRLRPGFVLAPAEASRALQNLASCLVDHNPTHVSDYLLSLDPKASRKGFMKDEVDCLGLFVGTPENPLADTRRLSFTDDGLRGMLSEALLRRSMPRVVALAPLARQQAYERPWFAVSTRNLVVDEMATCVADVDPADVASLIKSEPYSGGEGVAFGKLGVQFGPCLRVNAKLQANRQALRAALAEALFQRVYAPAPVVAVPTAPAPPR